MSDERSTNAHDKRIGQRIRTRRLEIGMSQERLAELLGVTFQQVQKYEKGVNRTSSSRLFDIALALDKSVASFFDAGPKESPSVTAQLLDTDHHAVGYAKLYVDADELVRPIMYAAVRAIALEGRGAIAGAHAAANAVRATKRKS